LELARALMAMGSPRDAVAVLQPALRGPLDASNRYVTHTELHEMLARAFDSAGEGDSAVAHYRWVVHPWRPPDPEFPPRRDSGQPVQQPEPERAPRVTPWMLMHVGRAVGVAVQMEMRGTVTVPVHVQVPASPPVPHYHGSAEPDQEQRDEEVGGWPEPVGQMEPEQHDHRHHHADTR